MVAVPAFFAVTVPFSTAATSTFELVHTTASVVFAGVSVAVSEAVSPTESSSFDELILMPVAETGFSKRTATSS